MHAECSHLLTVADKVTSWAQVRPDADILVPMYAPYTRADLVSPFAGPRPITALLRFEVVAGDGKYLIANHGAPPGLLRRNDSHARPWSSSPACEPIMT